MKKNIIKTTIIVAILSYASMAIESAFAYLLSDVWNWTWYIRMCNGLTYTQMLQKALTTPWITAIMAIELFVLIPALSVWAAKVWNEYKLSTRATEN